MEFTFWETKSISLPKGPLYGILFFVGAMALLLFLGRLASQAGPKEAKETTGFSLEELTAIEKVVAGGDPAKIDEMLVKDGLQLGADMSKWGLIRQWKNDVLVRLFVTELHANVKGQIGALQAQIEAEKAKAAAAEKGPAPAEAPAKAN